MSEQFISAVSSGTGPTTAIQAVSRTGPAIEGGNVDPSIGKSLPAPAVTPPEPALEAIVRQLNIESLTIGRDLRFQVDLESGLAVIQVLDRDTGDLIRQIPPEKVSPQIDADGALKVRLYDEMV